MSRVSTCDICGKHFYEDEVYCDCIENRQPINTEELARKLAPKLVEELGRELLRNNQSKRQLRVIRRAGKVIKLINEVQ